ncbi:MAG: hypothetical protein KGL04_07990 [Elusimicrobia bacterium]|nr:hypothetical protein [Elusimicrobiota bacterium]
MKRTTAAVLAAVLAALCAGASSAETPGGQSPAADFSNFTNQASYERFAKSLNCKSGAPNQLDPVLKYIVASAVLPASDDGLWCYDVKDGREDEDALSNAMKDGIHTYHGKMNCADYEQEIASYPLDTGLMGHKPYPMGGCVEGMEFKTVVSICLNALSLANPSYSKDECELLSTWQGLQKMLGAAKRYASVHGQPPYRGPSFASDICRFYWQYKHAAAPERFSSTISAPAVSQKACEWRTGLLGALAQTASSSERGVHQKQEEAQKRNLHRTICSEARRMSDGKIGCAAPPEAQSSVPQGAVAESSPKIQMSSFADTTSYLMVPEQDASDMYLDGAEKETVCVSPAEGGKCWKLALKVVSSVGAGKAGAVVGENYIAVVDYTNPGHIAQVTFPAGVACDPGGSSSGGSRCNSFDLGGGGKKYKFNLGVGQDGGITIFRADTGPLTRPPKEKGFWGGLVNLFNDVKYGVAGMFHGTTLTPVAYTSTAQLYLDRNDEVQNRPATQITLDGQKFNIVSQGGPRGCLLFFAVGAGGSLLEGPDEETPGYKPNMMACINHAEGLGMTAMDSGPQCLGTFARGNDVKGYSIQWMPQSASVGSDFQILRLPTPQSPPCSVGGVDESSTTANGSSGQNPGTTPGGKPTPGSGGDSGDLVKQCDAGSKDNGFDPKEGYTLHGDSETLRLYAKPVSTPEGEDYASLACYADGKNPRLFPLGGLVTDFNPSAPGGGVEMTAIQTLQYHGGVPVSDLADLAVAGAGPYSVTTQGGVNLADIIHAPSKSIYYISSGGELDSEANFNKPTDQGVLRSIFVFPKGAPASSVSAALNHWSGRIPADDSKQVEALRKGEGQMIPGVSGEISQISLIFKGETAKDINCESAVDVYVKGAKEPVKILDYAVKGQDVYLVDNSSKTCR